MQADLEPQLLSIKSTLAVAGISRSEIYRWLNRGTVQGVKVGRRTFILASSLRNAILTLPRYNQ